VILSCVVVVARAGAETTECTVVASVPMTILASGVYCLKAPVSGAGGITISADDVTVDLNGFALQSGAAGVSTHAAFKNATVRNGTIRAATFAVSLSNDGSGHRVEDVRAEGCGIRVGGHGALVRHNVVVGTTTASVGPNYGIVVRNGTGARISDNIVVNPAAGHRGEGGGIWAFGATGAVIERNVVRNTTVEPALPHRGIQAMMSDGAVLSGNHVANMKIGIAADFGTVLFVDNTVHGAEFPSFAFMGGVLVGTSNVSF
jgi:hypothetical protein